MSVTAPATPVATLVIAPYNDVEDLALDLARAQTLRDHENSPMAGALIAKLR